MQRVATRGAFFASLKRVILFHVDDRTTNFDRDISIDYTYLETFHDYKLFLDMLHGKKHTLPHICAEKSSILLYYEHSVRSPSPPL